MRPLLLLLLIASFHKPALARTIVLDGRAAGRTFDGIGAVSAGASSRLLIDYPEPARSQILDYLFKPGYGAALQHLKVEIGADVNSTDGSEPSHMRSRDDHDYTRGYEWWLMKEAVRRNPHVILDALPWGAPGWIGGGAFYSADMANYVADFIAAARKRHGLNIRYAGIWNERPFDIAYIKLLHRTLAARGLPTQIVCCDAYDEKQFAILDASNGDPELAAAVSVVGVHYPRKKDGTYTTTPLARQTGRVLWSSEDQPNGGGGPFVSRSWEIGGRILAQLYNRNFLRGGFTKTEIWSPITSYYESLAAPHSGLMYANTPWSGHYEVQGAIWATAHTTQFAWPGWKYLESAAGFLEDQGSFVSLKSPASGDWSVILETIDARAAQPVSFEIGEQLAKNTVHIWQTTKGKIFAHIADVRPDHGSFRFTFDPDSLYSLTTTTGQGKGSAQPPPDAPFPSTYSDNFESTTSNRTPKYLSDQDGAFEVRPCRQRSGKCLEQVITLKPIPWGPLPNPFTLAGDCSWTDYRITAGVLLAGAGEGALLGRIDSADVFQQPKAEWPSGYVFTLRKDGRWALLSCSYQAPPRTLAEGSSSAIAGGWHRLGLEFRQDMIRAELDGKGVSTVRDSNHRSGQFAIGCDWGYAQFDNLRVSRWPQPRERCTFH